MQKTYLQRWKQYLKENTHEAPDEFVHDKIDTFVQISDYATRRSLPESD